MPWFPTVVHQYQVLVYGTGTHGNSPVSGYARLAINLADSQSTDPGLHGNTFCIVEATSSGFVGWDSVRSQLEMFIVTAKENMDKQFLLCPIGLSCPNKNIDEFDELVALLDWPSNVVFLWRELVGEKGLKRLVDRRSDQLVTEIDSLKRVEVLVDPPIFPEAELRESQSCMESLVCILKCQDLAYGVNVDHLNGLSANHRNDIYECVKVVSGLKSFPKNLIHFEYERQMERISELQYKIAVEHSNKKRLLFLENELAYTNEVRKLSKS